MEITRVALFGDSTGILMSLAALHPVLPVAIVGAALRPQYQQDLRRHAASIGCPFLIQPRYRSPEYHDFLRELVESRPEMILVNSYSMILRSEILAIPGQGSVNVHGALLPRYRGANPIEWALINGEQSSGVTIHYMDTGIDTGPMIAQQEVPIHFEDTWTDVRQRINSEAQSVLANVVPKLLSRTATATPQDSIHATYFRRRSDEDGFFDWSWRIRDIYNLVRALVAPHPGARYQREQEVVVLPDWLPVGEIARLKYAPTVGGQKFTSGMLTLTPASVRSRELTRREQNAEIRFTIGGPEGEPVASVRLHAINWERTEAAISLEPVETAKGMDAQSSLRAAEELAKSFAKTELGLERATLVDC